MKTAILQVADQGPAESLIVMLQSVGYGCYYPSDALKNLLRRVGCDTVLDISSLVKSWGYEEPMFLSEATPSMMDKADLYVDIKAHRNGPKVWTKWPNLRNKTLWYRINGGEPEHVIKASGEDCGDEANPPCPILTPNLWYREQGPWSDRAYSMWPPFYRFNDYRRNVKEVFGPSICLIHNINGWGYGDLINRTRALGVKCYGTGSPDGLVNHSKIPGILSEALCMVHLKSSDAPGYALYEALASACPLVVSKRLIWRNRMQELFVPGETCLSFDLETHDALSDGQVNTCTVEIHDAITQLENKQENERIGTNGRNRLLELMWREDKDRDSLRAFMEKCYG